jgi:hypothetical protein
LDHGDEIGAQGADDEAPVAAPEEVAEEPAGGEPVLRDERAAALLAEIEEAYKGIRKLNAAALPPARFRAERDEASTSHEKLEGFRDRLAGILKEMEEARKS